MPQGGRKEIRNRPAKERIKMNLGGGERRDCITLIINRRRNASLYRKGGKKVGKRKKISRGAKRKKRRRMKASLFVP